jgi:indolepyruvate ferredoxin oxidoreductase
MRPIALRDRYELESGTVVLSGVQAIVRGIIDDARRQHRMGRSVGTFISGYPGSPLGGVDSALHREHELLDRHNIVFQPAVNEELAATAVLGATKRDVFVDRVDGVTGVWYGKCNGIDRCVDIFKYGNYGGMGENDAVIVIAGDDPTAKSSGIPGESEYTLAAAGIPVFAPSTIGEIHSFIAHGLAMSRYTGCWAGLKLVTDLCDGGATVALDRDSPGIVIPEVEGFDKFNTYMFFGQPILNAEDDLFGARHAAVKAYARANALDVAEVTGLHDRLGIVSYGKTFVDLRQAFADLGVDDERLRSLGIRLVKVGMPYPLDETRMLELTDGLEEILVVEEKRGFLEDQLRSALYGSPDAPRIVGKADEAGEPLVPVRGELDADSIAPLLRRRLRGLVDLPTAPGPVTELAVMNVAQRMPNYCSGCPHSRGTVAPEGATVLGGIGCHSMGLFMSQPERQYTFNVQMGGEGVPWVGAAPFVETPHILQNVGDGTYFHSASLAIRQCVDAGVDLTYRLLYNGFVSMTGGQELAGAGGVAALTRELEALGVARIVVATEERRMKGLGPRTTVVDPDEMTSVLKDLAAESGVTVLIHDRECALERRRSWRRGQAPPQTRLVIHELVCEGCGDCGSKSNCASLEPIDTEFGRKTRIQQSSCAVDLACLQGDCPSFISVTMEEAILPAVPSPPEVSQELIPEPEVHIGDEPMSVFSAGIGGTGVVTVNALLSFAALIEGLEVLTLDQTGLAQKGGPVVSHLIIGRKQENLLANKVGIGGADLYLAFDLLEAVQPANLRRTDRVRTNLVVVPTITPTGEMVRDVDIPLPEADPLVAHLRDRVGGKFVEVAARTIAEGLFGDHMKANVIAVGAASQAGLLPVSAGAFKEAIRLNGVEVEANLLAFDYGRLAVSEPQRVADLLLGGAKMVATPLKGRKAKDHQRLVEDVKPLPDEITEVIALRTAELIRYQNARYAAEYTSFISEVVAAEQKTMSGQWAVTEQVAHQLHRLMAYKDEYEVARLFLGKSWRAEIRDTFGAKTKISYNLHPPLLRGLGKKKKIRVGTWMDPLLRLLYSARWLRGRWFDPFGRSATRRLERELPSWYRVSVERALSRLNTSNYDEVVAVAEAPSMIRGYESVKEVSAARVRAKVAEQLKRIATAHPEQN